MRDAGCGVRGAGCGVRGAGCGVRGAGCGVRGAGCGVRDKIVPSLSDFSPPRSRSRFGLACPATAAQPLWTAVACYRFLRRGLGWRVLPGLRRGCLGAPAGRVHMDTPGRIESGSELPHSRDACGVGAANGQHSRSGLPRHRGAAALDCGSLLPLSLERPRLAGAPRASAGMPRRTGWASPYADPGADRKRKRASALQGRLRRRRMQPELR